MSDSILDTIVDANRQGALRGIYSVCSAHPLVLEAAFDRAVRDDSPLLVEATCNQVNQDGGYTGQTPEDFRQAVLAIAQQRGFEIARLVLGGDHLGPSPWQHLPADQAMANAEAMVAAYAQAGFEKLHLDASMACADDPVALDDRVVAERAALLCQAAETAAGDRRSRLRYVIGTEVPTPGGAQEHLDTVEVTSTADLRTTLETHHRIFAASGLSAAWSRVRAVVVQPGVEFGHTEVVDFVPEAAAELSDAITGWPNLVFEAHSTDYQTPAAYRALVAGHFAILKVGPALTFAMREALYALDAIAREAPGIETVDLRTTLERTMTADPRYWQAYYHGSDAEQQFARHFSLSDRIRYYWTRSEIAEELERLFQGLETRPIPPTLISQYLPNQYAAIRAGELADAPRSLVRHRIGETLATYAQACFPQSASDTRRVES
ncbi:D-tagatose-bisphosphate aldolase, class II, non-catalytic subunit [Aidingimonas halophila]|uniref:Tagatose-bisphosphate aldolase noncatalytic subunit n=1 Tax=Aidingimonas halophila TaxID=574349 RepID=A0A1H2ZBV5_9GAMM|nr:D-tagatose-bisphosphate aldolase, class II, non-catalytic subunit [Aidingimonas halophila]GHC15665.1 tagatose-6-phosphate kinase [Aidingimonas halophila]SDX14458.1 tagatose-bisphosphate aldolase noncatalytic subunit [Aidingimonas halophila]